MTTKVCNFCKEEKLVGLFPAKGRKCKKCANDWLIEHRRKQREAYLLLNPPQPKPIVTHKTCTKCLEYKPVEQFNFAKKSAGIRSPYCKPCQGKYGYQRAHLRPDYDRDRLRYRCNRFGISLGWYDAVLAKQNGVCALCHQPEVHLVKQGSGKIRKLAIDHDHITNKPRGLLCFRCNTALHQLEKHGLEWAGRAVAYLKET